MPAKEVSYQGMQKNLDYIKFQMKNQAHFVNFTTIDPNLTQFGLFSVLST